MAEIDELIARLNFSPSGSLRVQSLLAEAADALARLHAERDEARQALKIANTGGLDLLYAIRTAVGWTDKHALSFLPDECKRLKDAASSANDERDSMDDSSWFEDPDMGAR